MSAARELQKGRFHVSWIFNLIKTFIKVTIDLTPVAIQWVVQVWIFAWRIPVVGLVLSLLTCVFLAWLVLYLLYIAQLLILVCLGLLILLGILGVITLPLTLQLYAKELEESGRDDEATSWRARGSVSNVFAVIVTFFIVAIVGFYFLPFLSDNVGPSDFAVRCIFADVVVVLLATVLITPTGIAYRLSKKRSSVQTAPAVDTNSLEAPAPASPPVPKKSRKVRKNSLA